MSETQESPTADLREMSKGHKITPPGIKDKSGTKWELLPLDLNDIVDYEEKVGTSLFSENLGTIKAKEIMFLMYLSLRKTGCTAADLDAGRFKFASFNSFLRMFDLKAFTDSAEALADLLHMSGLGKGEGNPQKANQ